MCQRCDELKTLFRQKRSFELYYKVVDFFIKNDVSFLELIAGDCPVDEIMEELEAEKHYTIKHYYKCLECGCPFFFGACIRGEPIVEVDEPFPLPQIIKKKMWGKYGSIWNEKP